MFFNILLFLWAYYWPNKDCGAPPREMVRCIYATTSYCKFIHQRIDGFNFCNNRTKHYSIPEVISTTIPPPELSVSAQHPSTAPTSHHQKVSNSLKARSKFCQSPAVTSPAGLSRYLRCFQEPNPEALPDTHFHPPLRMKGGGFKSEVQHPWIQ